MGLTLRYDWAETEISKLTPQLVGIGLQIDTPLGVKLGATPAMTLDWQRGAAVLSFAEAQLGAVRDYGNALTRWRDGFLIDRTPEAATGPQLTLPTPSPLVAAALADPDFLTDFLDRCNDTVKIFEGNGITEGERRQLGLLIPKAPPAPADMQPTVRSVHEFPGGKVEINVDRQNQAQVKVTVTLDDGQIFTKTLPSAKIPMGLPTDRVHGFSIVAQYADKFGEVYGLESAAFEGRSLI